MANLGPNFYPKLVQVAKETGMRPEDLLNVMASESGINPAERNPHSNASGLIQFMPGTLNNVGFNGTHTDFRKLSGEEQLDYIKKYIQDKTKFNQKPFGSADQYYVANFWPAGLKLSGVKNNDLNTAIVEENPEIVNINGTDYSKKYYDIGMKINANQERAAYKENASLDPGKDGKITLGDLQKVLHGVARGKNFQNALAQMEKQTGYTPTQDYSSNVPQSAVALKSPENSLDQLDQMMSQFLNAAANTQYNTRFLKKTAYKKHLIPTDLLITLNSNHTEDTIECSRILCSAIDEELFSDANIFTDGTNVEVGFTIYGSKQLSINATKQLCETIINIFNDITKSNIQTKIYIDKTSKYAPLDIKTANTNYNKFHLKYIMENSNGSS